VHLVEALAQLPRDIPARLIVIGDGPESPRIAARARDLGVSERVELRGRQSDDALRTAYASADVFVLPAIVDARGDTEGLGVVLLEAMNFGVPVIASATGGIVDIVVDGKTGLLVSPGDAAALADALGRIAGDADLADRLGAQGRDWVREKFSWSAIVSKWQAVYQRALGG
jgi:glycosyltransferase involved in cell wall biosynthesis